MNKNFIILIRIFIILSLEYHSTNGTKIKTKTMGKLHEYQKHDTEILTQVFDDTTSKEQNEIIKKSLNADDIVDDDFLEIKEVEVQNCECTKNILVNKKTRYDDTSDNSKIAFEQTTCSEGAFRRGKGQKIIGFSYFRPPTDTLAMFSRMKDYIGGVKGNLDLMPKYYGDGWVMRLYLDFSSLNPKLQKHICELACDYHYFDICDVRHLPGNPINDATKIYAANWRFFPTLDPQVERFVSRDLDSRFTDREYAAVKEWIESEKYFHIMRDRPEQIDWPIFAGQWGTYFKNGDDNSFRYNWTKTWKQALHEPIIWATRNQYTLDQVFLKRYIWPWVTDYSIAHDSYFCEKFPNTRPFPVKRVENDPTNYVAAVPCENHIVTQKCPLACRPKNHPDWELC